MGLKNLKIFVLLIAVQPVFAQYYYKDILSIQQTAFTQQQYKTNKIKKVMLSSFENDDQPSEFFICFQEVSPTFKVTKTFTQSVASMQSALVSQFNDKMQLIKTTDSSNATLSNTTYTYTAEGKVSQLNISIQSYVNNHTEYEKHVWVYNEKSWPETMLRVRNNTDTQVVKLKCDENGNPVEEEWFTKGKSSNLYYYYYDKENRLTDIVRFNERVKKLLPEMIFEYDGESRLTQMMTVPQNSSNYTIWRYSYDEKGLKIKESCYNKQKQLMGYITYRYQ
jgi:hypothetical protein